MASVPRPVRGKGGKKRPRVGPFRPDARSESLELIVYVAPRGPSNRSCSKSQKGVRRTNYRAPYSGIRLP